MRYPLTGHEIVPPVSPRACRRGRVVGGGEKGGRGGEEEGSGGEVEGGEGGRR